MDSPDYEDELWEHVMKATAALEGLITRSQRMATVDIYRANDPDALPGVKKIYLEQLTASMEKKQRTLLPPLSRLNKVLRDTDDQIRLNKAMSAPCKRLPPEVLSEIFMFAASHPYHPLTDMIHRHRYSFTAVCSLWRAVAHNTVHLWTEVFMCFGKTADILTRELRRTKCRPLDVEIETIDSRSPAIREAWDVLRQEGHRWRTLILYYPFTIGGVPNSVACPALQTLDVTTHLTRRESVDGDNPPFGEALLFGYLSDAPSLRRVTLTLMRIDEPAQIRFPDSWKLSHLTLDVDCCDDPLHLLRNVIEQAAATSEALKIEVQESNGIPRPVNSPTFHFAVLQELQLHELAHCFIVFIDAPVLASLCITMTGVPSFEDDYTWDTLDYPPIPEVLRKVAGYTALSKLELDGIALREASTLLATLRGLPNIEWLRLAESYAYEGKLISSALLAGLTRGGVSVDGVDIPCSALCPLPNLTEFFVHLGKHDAADVSSLAVSLRRLALSRHPSVPHLEDDESNSLRSLDAFQATYGLRWAYFAADVVPSWGERFEEDEAWDSD